MSTRTDVNAVKKTTSKVIATRAEHPFKAPANADEVVGGPSPLADLRDPEYPFPEPATLTIREGYDGFTVLWLQDGTPPSNPWGWEGSWFKKMLTVQDTTPVTIHPSSSCVIIVDFKDGFDPTPINLHYYANLYLN